MNKELAKTLTTALVQFIDRERPEGTMCCSNTDCENIQGAFEEGEYEVVEAFVKKKLSSLTEFEMALRQIIEVTLSDEVPNGSGGTMSWAVALSDDDIKKLAPKVLAITRKQLIKDGYVIEKKAFYDAVEKVSPEVMKEVSDNVDKENELAKKVIDGKDFYPKEYAQPWCLRIGWVCTNPMRDCTNCFPTLERLNTASDTSTLKAEG